MKPGYVLLITGETLGKGAEELGKKLMCNALYALTSADVLPTHILLMNGGVHLLREDSECLESLKALEVKGVEVLACGVCLDYYGMKEAMAAGKAGNMYSSMEVMSKADHVITFS